MTELVGQTLGQYRIETPLGSGGMGQVFRGVHMALHKPVAIKVMQAQYALSPDFRSRFLREARVAALQHPNIVEVYDFAEQDGNLYIVMELMTGDSLRALLNRSTGQPLPLALGLDLMRQAAQGLAAAQARNIVHRDIKPDNLLLTQVDDIQPGEKRYVLKIGDFGLARLAQSDTFTSIGAPKGTPAYMSPEQCLGKTLDERSDLYSLGIVLYEVVIGYRPFQINDFSEALNKHVNVLPPLPSKERSDLLPGVEEIILRCLAKKPEDRYATATELAIALQQASGNIRSQPMMPSPPSPAQLTATPETVLQPLVAGGTPPPMVSTPMTYSAVPLIRVSDQSGQMLQEVDMKSQGLLIGRQSGNDIILSAEVVSNQHLQALWDGKQVTVKDLGSRNGTLLGGVRLLPQVSQPWKEEQELRIGPFRLHLERPVLASMQSLSAAVQPSNAASIESNSSRIGISVQPRTLLITPGKPTVIQVTLTNLGNTVDGFTLAVEGVAPEWVQGSSEIVRLLPDKKQNVELSVNVARVPKNHAQEYPVTIKARSLEKPQEVGTVQAKWDVQPFEDSILNIELPTSVSGRGSATYCITLQNNGNAETSYQLSGEDDKKKIAYHFGSNPVDLKQGAETKVPLTVKTRPRWFGNEQRQAFQIYANSVGGKKLNAPRQGEFVNKALFPTWLLSAIILLTVLAPAAVIAYNTYFVKNMRMLSSTSSQSQTVNATGTKQITAMQAQGMLLFYSNLSISYPANTPFNGSDGVQVVIDQDVNISENADFSAQKVSVPAHAVSFGSIGNIGIHDININTDSHSQVSCNEAPTSDIVGSNIPLYAHPFITLHPEVPLSGGGFTVICNQQAFTGGQDAQTDHVVQKSDIDGAANSLIIQLTSSVQASLSTQIRPNEHLMGTPQCTSNTTSDHVAGDIASQVTVTVTMNCTDEVST